MSAFNFAARPCSRNARRIWGSQARIWLFSPERAGVPRGGGSLRKCRPLRPAAMLQAPTGAPSAAIFLPVAAGFFRPTAKPFARQPKKVRLRPPKSISRWRSERNSNIRVTSIKNTERERALARRSTQAGIIRTARGRSSAHNSLQSRIQRTDRSRRDADQWPRCLNEILDQARSAS